MNEKPEAWTAIDSFVWPHIAANLIREQHAEIKRLKADNDALRRELKEIEENAVISLEMQEWP
jgi:cell division protein FtsB